MNQKELLKKEVDLINNPEIKNFVEIFLDNVPEYFYKIAASSTGKYHPSYAIGEGGLVRHTIAATRIAYELFRTEMFKYNNDEQDLIIASLIMHDTYKKGNIENKYTLTEHPLIAAQAVRTCKAEINPEWREILMKNISTHMGRWTRDFKSGMNVLEPPKNGMQKFVHMCDYLASRKCLEFNFEAPLSK